MATLQPSPALEPTRMPVPEPVLTTPPVKVAIAPFSTWMAVVEPLIVLLLTESVPAELTRVAPGPPAVFPLAVQLVRNAVPYSLTKPPPAIVALLPMMLQLARLTVPRLL